MKKSIIAVVILIFVASMLCACNNTAQKEQEYYEQLASDIEAVNAVLSPVVNATTDFKSVNVEILVKSRDGVSRGSETEKGWKDEYVDQNGEEKSYEETCTISCINVTAVEGGRYDLKFVSYKPVTKDYYSKNITKKSYDKYLEVSSSMEKSVVAAELQNQVSQLADMAEYANISEFASYITSATDGWKITNRAARIKSRSLLTIDGEWLTPFDRSVSSNFGEDINYDWNKVAGIAETTATVSYKKGRVIKFEKYDENIISYYTENNVVDKSLVLKADVVSTQYVLIEFEYDK